MRHKVYGRKLGRNKAERNSLFKNLLGSLILRGSIRTTESKAKAIKGLVDKVINKAKNKPNPLLKAIVPSLKNRSSGYTSIVKMGPRKGDGAMMVNMTLLTEKKEVRK